MILKQNFLIALALLLILASCGDDTDDPVLSSDKKITKFSISDKDALIDEANKTIFMSVVKGTNLSALTPTVEISTKAAVNPSSGTEKDFTNTVSYKVTAEDNSTVDYAVTVVDYCALADNVYAFSYNGKEYEFVKEGKTWADAAACALERGGSLARINDTDENNAIFDEIMNNSGVDVNNTKSGDGGNASYVWIGGNDLETEGKWIWDGTNSGTGDQFWEGDNYGKVVGGLFSNWGIEPDNFGSGQDCLGLALTNWPAGSGSLGSAKQWNDVKKNNKLYFVIELD